MKLCGITLENFRVFKEPTTFEFAPISVLTGANNAGKSTVFKALLLLKDNWEKNKLTQLKFDNKKHGLNSFQEIINYDNAIEFKRPSKSNREKLVAFTLWYNWDVKTELKELEINSGIDLKDLEKIGLHWEYKKNEEEGQLIKFLIKLKTGKYDTNHLNEIEIFQIYNQKEGQEIVVSLILDWILRRLKEEIKEFSNKIKISDKAVDLIKYDKEDKEDIGNQGVHLNLDNLTLIDYLNSEEIRIRWKFLMEEKKLLKIRETDLELKKRDLNNKLEEIESSQDENNKMFSKEIEQLQRERDQIESELKESQKIYIPNDDDKIAREQGYENEKKILDKKILNKEQEFELHRGREYLSKERIDKEYKNVIIEENTILDKKEELEKKEKILISDVKDEIPKFLEFELAKVLFQILQDRFLNEFEIYNQNDGFDSFVVQNEELKFSSIFYDLKSQQNWWKLLESRFQNASIFRDFGKYSFYDLLPNFPIEIRDLFYNQKLDEVFDLSQVYEFFLEKTFRSLSSFLEPFFSQIPIIFISSNRGAPRRIYDSGDFNSDFDSAVNGWTRLDPADKDIASDFIRDALKIFDLGDDFNVKHLEGSFYQVFVNNGSRESNIADLGFGISQLLPIILHTSICIEQSTLIMIEEPGSNLHPNFQSLLADLFTISIKDKDLSFLLETHSEYFVRKLQFKVAKGDVDHNKIRMYYILQKPGNSKKEEVKIDPFGELSDNYKDLWKGFYDEATTLEDRRQYEELKTILKRYDKEKPIFLSYKNEDKEGNPSGDREFVKEIKAALRSKKLLAWIDIYELKGGSRTHDEIEEAIHNCSVFIPIISRLYLESCLVKKGEKIPYIKKELNKFFHYHEEEEPKGKTIIPVLRDDINRDDLGKIDRKLKKFLPIKVDENFQQFFNQLLDAIMKALNGIEKLN